MSVFSLSQYPQAILKADKNCLHFRYFETNTREIIHGENVCFVAIEGKHFDGHNFIQHAFEKGVRNFVVQKENYVQNLPVNYILTKNSIAFFQQCVAEYRKQFDIPVIGITGSNGKTVVKEWLCDILQAKYTVTKSPKSYNSQIGVPLSVQELSYNTQIAVFEAGISEKNEMEALAHIIQPIITLLTNIGTAHQENFSSYEEKLFEKLTLAKNSEVLIYYADDFLLQNVPKYPNLPNSVLCVGAYPQCDIRIMNIHTGVAHTECTVLYQGKTHTFQIPFIDEVSLKNVYLVIATCLYLNLSSELIQKELLDLQPVSMRLEWITAHPSITILNDTYSSDIVSIRQAVQTLVQSKGNPKKIAILTDLDYKGIDAQFIHQEVLHFLDTTPLDKIFLAGAYFFELKNEAKTSKFVFYATVEELEAHLPVQELYNSVVLLKGARKYNLEQFIPKITESAHPTYLKINLNTLADNLRYFRKLISPQTKVMAMVKAFSYGGGTWEIAQELAYQQVDYLAVAYTDEAVFLRKKGIHIPILVMNAIPQDIQRCIEYNLEVQVHNFEQLIQFEKNIPSLNTLNIHLKVDTGMHRLGFLPHQFENALRFLQQKKTQFEVKGILSHIAAADNPEHDAYTHAQIQIFQDIVGQCTKLYPHALAHILNTAGVLRFKYAQFDMVRLGIGMYGISPTLHQYGFQEIMSLHSKIVAVQQYEDIVSIGYNRSEYTKQKNSIIATLPIGYGDGISRKWSNGKGKVLVKGEFAPVIGRVCMDMMMIDVTHIPDVKVGDEAILIGKQGKNEIKANEVAQWCDTIGYEVVTTINQRVKRLYVKE
jgi:alanine racemase